MPTAYVTGATGFVGGHLVRKLRQRGWTVRALVRPTTCHNMLNQTGVDIISGHLGEFQKIQSSMEGCDLVFHAAADYRLWARNPSEMYETNVTGTRHVLQAALDNGVPRVVYTSTVGTIGLDDHGTPANESTFLQLDSQTGHYKKSKFLAEQEAFRFAEKGLPVVIVNPSAPIGSHDWKPTPTGRIVVDFLNRKMPMYLDTGLNLVDVEDVAEGHLLAAEKGRVGERYILGNEDLTLQQILTLLSEITGIPAPKIRCPYPMALMAAWFSESWTRISGAREPKVPLEGVNMARKYMFFDSSKAIQELGYQPGSTRTALHKAVQWFHDHDYLKRPLPPTFIPLPLPSQLSPSPVSVSMDEEESVAFVK